MRIAFDLDSTLIPYAEEFPAQKSLPAPLAWWFKESLRQGSVPLLRDLRKQGCEIWIYTTSGRDAVYLRIWFLLLGVWVGGVVNYHRHEALLRKNRCPKISKYPPAFGIDLLIDDSDGVREEGQQNGFDVLLIHPSDLNWIQTVQKAVQMRYRKSKI